MAAAAAAAEKKASGIVAIDVSELLIVTDYFVICTGNSDPQVRAIEEEVEKRLREEFGLRPVGREGVRSRDWVLLDYGSVIVHIFQPDTREFYRLESLWKDAPRLDLPDFGSRAAAASAEEAT